VRWDPEILRLQDVASAVVGVERDEQWADPQLLLRFPDEAQSWPLTPHIDQVPPWAPDREFAAIVGIAITRSWAEDGCLMVWPGSHRERPSSPEPVELNAGDMVIMHPELLHCSGLNRGGAVRYAAYFRLLAAPDERVAS
jgi:ectoine hydroxylase-related dioxygenase (phytanoyl-CoA dioxygenase family)